METIYRFLPPTFALVLFLFFSFLYIYQSTTTKFYLNLSSKRETASLTFGTGTLYARISRERKGKCAARRHTVRAHLGTNQPKSCADSNRSASQFVRYALLARARPLCALGRLGLSPRGRARGRRLFNASHLPCLVPSDLSPDAAPFLFGVSSVN